MKTALSHFAAVLVAFVAFSLVDATSFAFDTFNVWPDLAPGETADTEKPTFEYWAPAEKTTDACIIVCPGGGYGMLAYPHEGEMIANYFVSKGVTTVVLKYRVPRRKGWPKHLAAWQDAQRTVRVVRSHAEEWGINPDKIGILGFSAGGHLTLMVSTTSRTNSYESIDELDKIPCNVNFAVPVYPAYVLEDGADSVNKNKGNDSPMVGDFAFDENTPQMCLIHGDADPISALGSAAVYAKLHQMGIPCEMHVYAEIEHGFGGRPNDDHVGNWLDRVYAWMKATKICE